MRSPKYPDVFAAGDCAAVSTTVLANAAFGRLTWIKDYIH